MVRSSVAVTTTSASDSITPSTPNRMSVSAAFAQPRLRGTGRLGFVEQLQPLVDDDPRLSRSASWACVEGVERLLVLALGPVGGALQALDAHLSGEVAALDATSGFVGDELVVERLLGGRPSPVRPS